MKAGNNHIKALTGEDKESPGEDNSEKKPSASVGWSGFHVGMSNLVQGHDCSMAHEAMCKDMRDCIVLNNGSSLSLFANNKLVENVRRSESKSLLATNAGVKENHMKATVP